MGEMSQEAFLQTAITIPDDQDYTMKEYQVERNQECTFSDATTCLQFTNDCLEDYQIENTPFL